MDFTNFKKWLNESKADHKKVNLPQLSGQDNTCQTFCPRATIVWLIKLKKDWEKNFSQDELKNLIDNSFVVKKYDGDYIEGLQSGKNSLTFKSKQDSKPRNVIPEEEEVRGLESEGVRPLTGGYITVRPRKRSAGEDYEEYGNYVSQDRRIEIPSTAISNIKAIGGCALTCLHMSGGQVTSKTVGGYKKTHMFLSNENMFYNETLVQYFQSALKALYNKCQNEEKNIDHYAIRLNGTTDIIHYAKKFLIDPKTIKSINRTIEKLRKNNFVLNPLQESELDYQYPVNFFEIFNALWNSITKNVKCKLDPTFVQSEFIHFYDYTALEALKNKYSRKELPSNYHITFSAKEGNIESIIDALQRGMGVALPIWIGGVKKLEKIKFPSMWYPYGYQTGIGYRIVDGDSYDARFLDKKIYKIPENEGYVIGLRAKGKLEDIEDYDSGFAERILLNTKTPDVNALKNFAKKYNNKISLRLPNFEQVKQDFIQLTGGAFNKRFNPSDPAINEIIYEQIIYTLRRNGVEINKLDPIKSKQYFDSQEAKGIERLVNLKDLNYDNLHSTIAGTSTKTDKENAKIGKTSMSGTSSKVEKSLGYKVSTNQTNMLPNTLYYSIRNSLEKLKNKK